MGLAASDEYFIAVVEGGGKYICVATLGYFQTFAQPLHRVGEIAHCDIGLLYAVEQAFYLFFREGTHSLDNKCPSGKVA